MLWCFRCYWVTVRWCFAAFFLLLYTTYSITCLVAKYNDEIKKKLKKWKKEKKYCGGCDGGRRRKGNGMSGTQKHALDPNNLLMLLALPVGVYVCRWVALLYWNDTFCWHSQNNKMIIKSDKFSPNITSVDCLYWGFKFSNLLKRI